MLRDEQIELRRQRAKADRYRIENVGKNRVFSDYRVSNPVSGGEYTVAIRGFSTGDNTCTCPDFRANTLGTCKHIEAVLEELTEDNPAHVRKMKKQVVRPEVYLHYGEALRLGVLLPPRHTDKLAAVAKKYFDDRGLWTDRGRYEDLLADVERVPEEVTIRSDAADFIRREAERAELRQREGEWLAQIDAGTFEPHLLSVPLYDYQLRGAAFLAGRGRAILGDEMGLGKTLMTLAAVELLARERGISRVLVVAPASVKYQWESEVRKFTRRAVQTIEGGPDDRKDQYAAPTFYRLVNYEQVVRDRDAINAWKPDVIVLDEAQRIKNWASKTSQAVKKLVSRYAFVLTGTPLENKLEELYSIVQFVDERRFGPAFQFLQDHRVLDDNGNLTGYRNLDKIRERLEPIFLRRTRAEVLTQLPARTDNTVFVELSEAQRVPYEEQRVTLARLLGKPHLTDPDRKRVLATLANLRLICDSTFLFDKTTHHSPKLDEFGELVPELLDGLVSRETEAGAPASVSRLSESGGHKLVVFSQWETMLHLASDVLDRLNVKHALLHGGLSGDQRKAALAEFGTDADCRVFLSTDAGGVGLNLQVADTVVNLELPWNPAVLEQRIARVHRLGQGRPVRVVNLVTRGTVEEKVLKTLGLKKALFEGVFDGDEDEIAFSAVNPGGFLSTVRELIGERREEPAAAPAPLPAATDTGPSFTPQAVAMFEMLAAWLADDGVMKGLSEEQKQRVAVAARRLS